MDVATITAAYQGIKATREILVAGFDAKVDAEARLKIDDALQKLGDTQETLYALRDELLLLQETNNNLRQELAESVAWKNKEAQYELAKTSGEAVVYKFKDNPEHYACPSCFNKKEIHILQSNRTASGKYRCTGCESEYPVEPKRDLPVHIPTPINPMGY